MTLLHLWFWCNFRLPIDSASRTCTLSNRSSCNAGKSHDLFKLSRSHSNFSRRCSLAFQWRRRPLGLSVLIYFVRANTLFSETRTHSPSSPYFQAMWASNFNSPSHPAAVTRNAFVGHWVADEDWLSPITSSYTLWRKLARSCVETSRRTHVSLNWTLDGPGARWELWKCRVEFEERNVFHNGQGSHRIVRIFLEFIYFRRSSHAIATHIFQWQSFESSPYPACMLLSIGIRRNTSLSTPASNSYVIIHSEESDASCQHFYPPSALNTYTSTLPTKDATLLFCDTSHPLAPSRNNSSSLYSWKLTPNRMWMANSKATSPSAYLPPSFSLSPRLQASLQDPERVWVGRIYVWPTRDGYRLVVH